MMLSVATMRDDGEHATNPQLGMGSWRSRRLGGDVFRLLTDRDPTTLTASRRRCPDDLGAAV
jgi:hypothetical protein